MIAWLNSLSETYTNRCIFGDSIFMLIPVGCLGGRLFFQPVAQKAKAKKALSLDLVLNYYISSKAFSAAEKGQTIDGEGNELLLVILIKKFWKKDFDIF
jgi:hypothetical protein